MSVDMVLIILAIVLVLAFHPIMGAIDNKFGQPITSIMYGVLVFTIVILMTVAE